MRQRQSDDLPRFVNDAEASSFRIRRRYLYYLAGFVFVCWLLYPSRSKGDDALNVNWANYAYSLYATDSATLCHAVILFDTLKKLGSKADRVLFYPQYWDTKVESSRDRDSQLLVMARDKYKVKLHPIKLLSVEGRTKDAWTGTWSQSVTKFMSFSLAYYDRVIALDSDVTLLKSIDELFLLPPTPMAMPRAYWTTNKPWPLTSMLMVIKPDLDEFEKFKQTIRIGGTGRLIDEHRFDMELVNERFQDSALVLPHRPYALLTGEFRSHDHAAYLGSDDEIWDAEAVFKQAKVVHFSDWPLPKPWIMWPTKGLEEMQPDCGGSHESCAERRIWKGLYDDFRQKRRDVCKLLSVPAPDWYSIQDTRQGRNATDGTAHVAAEIPGDVL
ncbi:glycosyltransferase family 8 protein [Dothidotthia symphoricarpi CBS 119687]|uniref:Glycosyltransferase family 8 protein n=1 Tax=Dothidotthia symphoricarpi CBS 119687 TaxID=1392245 RepID=A0A6A6AEV5_9PLEO|nr:glycosyltransferase family 8 protein [Dothidotthia symphoricarpi CBS 119687]KAF2129843.1 glycosyltransferase family 8 protein [Dothidotthia symphoricarpi CBS 119687]